MNQFSGPESFRLFVEENFGGLANFARSVLGSSLDAEDVAQDAFVILYQKRSSLRPEGSPRAYLYRVALRLCLARRRRDARRNALSVLLAPLAAREAAPSLDPIDSWFRNLTARQSAIAHLFFAEDMDPAEISARLRIAPSTVRVQLKRIRSRLRELHGVSPVSTRCPDVQ